MGSDNLPMLGSSIVEDPLDEVVAVLVTRNVNQRDASAVSTSFTNAVQVARKKIAAPDLETLLDNLGSELVSAILRCISNNMVNGSAAVRGGTVFADVLDAPVSKLAVGNNVNVGKHFFDARTL
jgi:hypothetical protein